MSKRKVKKKFKIFFLLVIILVGIITLGYFKNNQINELTSNNKEEQKDPVEEKVKTYNLSLAATGDALLHLSGAGARV